MNSESAAQAQDQMKTILEGAPMMPVHYRLWVLSAGGTLLDGLALAAFGIALPLIKQAYDISDLMVGALGAAYVMGMVVGAMMGGRASDKIGRRRLFLFSMTFIGVVALVSAFAWSPEIILATQFLIGCAIGSEFPNSSAYVSDVMPDSTRDRMLVATIAAQAVGMLAGVGIGYAILSLDPEISVWRYFLGMRSVVALFFVVRRLSMPESPIWLMIQGRNAEASVAIGSLVPERKDDVDILSKTAADQKLGSGDGGEIATVGIGKLFTRSYLRRTVLVASAWFLMDISTYGVGQFAPSLLATLSSGDSSGGPIAVEFASIQGTGVLDFFLLVGFLVGMWAVPRFGQIRMQSIGFLGMVVGMGTLVVALHTSTGGQFNMPLIFVGFIIFNLLMNMGPNSTTFGLPALLFPPEMRATAAGFAAASAKTGATLGLFFLPTIKDAIGLENTLVLLGALSGLAFVITATLGSGLLPSPDRGKDAAVGRVA
jgi:MFS family permease